MNGFNYRPSFRSQRDANVLVRTSQGVRDIADPALPNIEAMGISPVQIARILWQKEDSTNTVMPRRVFLLVRRYRPLSEEQQHRDPYRAFGFALAGCLFCDELLDLEIIQAQDVICPFASTPQRKTDERSNEHNTSEESRIHVYPIIKVLSILFPENFCGGN